MYDKKNYGRGWGERNESAAVLVFPLQPFPLPFLCGFLGVLPLKAGAPPTRTARIKAEQHQLTLPPPRPTEDSCTRSHDGEIVSLCVWNIRGTWKIFDETKTARFMLTLNDLVRKSLALGYFTPSAIFYSDFFSRPRTSSIPHPPGKKG